LENAAVCRPPLRNLIQTCLLCAAMLQALTSGAQPVTKIASGAGSSDSLVLKVGGSLWTMGYNGFGMLGAGNGYINKVPQLILDEPAAGAARGEVLH
jgi:hypothetical protein